jgi:hypothetical protein
MNFLKKYTKYDYLFWGILLVAILLRFFNLFNIPFTHDEFSTLFRTNFNSFDELIEKGVKIDAHPAGLQVFVYYYKQIFGASNWVIKTPFLLFGVLSVYFVFKIYRNWFNLTIAYVAAAFIASIQFMVMYSQIARPYSSGLFFVLVTVYCWGKLFLEKKNTSVYYFYYALFGILCLYNHHFSSLMFVIITVTSVFFISKEQLLKFTVSILCVVLLYIPHINIFLAQLSLGGLSEWLNKPTPHFFIDYLKYAFQFSVLNLILISGILLICIFSFSKKLFFSKQTLLFFSWFFVPFLIGYFYSVYRAPVLQYSVLIFSFPFLFGILFSGLKEQRFLINMILVIMIVLTNVFLLIFQRKHYGLFNQSCYQHFILDYPKEINQEKLISMFDVEYSHKKIVNFYMYKHKFKRSIHWMEQYRKVDQFVQFLKHVSKTKKYFYYASVFDADPIYVQLIRDYFPTIQFQHNYYTGCIYLFSTKINKTEQNKYIFEKNLSSFYADSLSEYSKGMEVNILNSGAKPMDIVDLSITTPINYEGNAQLVSAIQLGDSVLDWRGTHFDSLKSNVISGKRVVHLSVQLHENYFKNPNIVLKTYVWKSIKDTFMVSDYQLKIRKGNNKLFGLFYPIY